MTSMAPTRKNWKVGRMRSYAASETKRSEFSSVPRPFLPRPLGRVWEPNYSELAMTKKHAENMIVLQATGCSSEGRILVVSQQ